MAGRGMAKNGLHEKDEEWKHKHYYCKAKCFDITSGGKIIVLNEAEAHENDLYASHRVLLRAGKNEAIAIIDLSKDLVDRGEVGVFSEVASELGVDDGAQIDVIHLKRPASIEYIRKKMDGRALSRPEIDAIMRELMSNSLSEPELASFITSVYIRGMNDDEVVGLTESLVGTGQTLNLGRRPVCDKHCIGGVAGNRTTMVLVPIIAAAGLYIPKTSSRSITSAAGTADTMETLCSVSLELDEMRRIVRKSHGCVVWGGALRLASADDKLIKIRNPLSLDPKGVMLASILAKKKSVGAEHVIIDIPIGRGAKVPDAKAANTLARDFLNIGKRLGMRVEVLITDGGDPIGNGIGPALECKDVLSVLNSQGPEDLRDKSCQLAGALFELSGKVKKGRGYAAAEQMISSGKALSKFQEIVELQGGKPHLKMGDIPDAAYKYEFKASQDGRVSYVDNHLITKVARAAGAPNDKEAGILLHCEKGDKVKRGETLFEIHSGSETKLDFAIKALEGWDPIELQKVVFSSMR